MRNSLGMIIVVLCIGIAIGYFLSGSKQIASYKLSQQATPKTADVSMLPTLLDNKSFSGFSLTTEQIQEIKSDQKNVTGLTQSGFSYPEKNIFCASDEQSKFIQKLYEGLFITGDLTQIPDDLKIIPRQTFLDYIESKQTDNQYIKLLLLKEDTIKEAILDRKVSDVYRAVQEMMLTLGFKPEKKEDYRHMDILILMVAKKFQIEGPELSGVLNGCWNFATGKLSEEQLIESLTRK